MLKVAEAIDNLSSEDFANLVDILIQYDGFCNEEISEELDNVKDDIRGDIEYAIHSDELLEALYGDEDE